MSKEIYHIVAWDHFSSDNPEEFSCQVSFIGEYIGQSENYIRLRHIKADINDPNSAEETHVIFKKAIISKQLYKQEQDE